MMGSLVRQTYHAVDKKTGKTALRTAKKWYIQIKVDGKWKREPAHTDKAQSLRKLVRREAEIAQGVEDSYDVFSKQLARPISEHIDEYIADLVNRGNSKDHINTTKQRVTWICETGKIERIPELTRSRVNTAIAQRPGSQASKNHYLTAIKMFAKWLVDDRRAKDNAIAGLHGKATGGEKSKYRRPLTAAEFTKLLKSTDKGPVRLGITGKDRVALYVLSAFTGFRRRELSSVLPESFDLGDEPSVGVVRGYSKRRRVERIPLNEIIAIYFRDWLAGKVASQRLWNIERARTAEMIQADLDAAGIDHEAGGKTVDFHSLRQNFITGLALSGVVPKIAQQLARHSTIDLTMNTYAKVTSAEERTAVDRLEAPAFLAQNLTQANSKRRNNAKQLRTINGSMYDAKHRLNLSKRKPTETGKKKGATRKTGRP